MESLMEFRICDAFLQVNRSFDALVSSSDTEVRISGHDSVNIVQKQVPGKICPGGEASGS